MPITTKTLFRVIILIVMTWLYLKLHFPFATYVTIRASFLILYLVDF